MFEKPFFFSQNAWKNYWPYYANIDSVYKS